MKIFTMFNNGSSVRIVIKRDTIVEVVPGRVVNTRFRVMPSGQYLISYDVRVTHEYSGNENNSKLIQAPTKRLSVGLNEDTLIEYQGLREGILTAVNHSSINLEHWINSNPRNKIKGFPLERIYEFDVKKEFRLNELVKTDSAAWKKCRVVSVEVRFMNTQNTIVVYGLKSLNSSYQSFDIRESFLLEFNQPISPIRVYQPSLFESKFINIGKKLQAKNKGKALKGQLEFVF